jgi:hypothetical protein
VKSLKVIVCATRGNGDKTYYTLSGTKDYIKVRMGMMSRINGLVPDFVFEQKSEVEI